MPLAHSLAQMCGGSRSAEGEVGDDFRSNAAVSEAAPIGRAKRKWDGGCPDEPRRPAAHQTGCSPCAGPTIKKVQCWNCCGVPTDMADVREGRRRGSADTCGVAPCGTGIKWSVGGAGCPRHRHFQPMFCSKFDCSASGFLPGDFRPCFPLLTVRMCTHPLPSSSVHSGLPFLSLALLSLILSPTLLPFALG